MRTFTENKLSYDSVFKETGWGLYNKLLLGLTCLCLFSEAIAFMAIPFILPISTCEIKMSENIIVVISACQSFGMATGGLIMSSAADLFGRKLLLSASMVVIFASCLSAGFSHEPIFTSVTAVFLGSGLAAHSNIARINLLESIPGNKRAKCLIFCDLFWNLGSVLLPGICWSIMSLPHESNRTVLKVGSFRMLYTVAGLSSIIIACATSLMQESPRFLLMQRKYEAALLTLRHIYCINKSKHWHSCKIKLDEISGLIHDYDLDIYNPQRSWFEQFFVLFTRLAKSIKKSIARQHLRNLMIFTLCKITTMFGPLLVNMWLCKVLIFVEEQNDCHINGIDVIHVEVSQPKCTFSKHTMLYVHFLSQIASGFGGIVILLFIVSYFGRRKIIVAAYIVSGLASFCMAFIQNILPLRIIMSALFMMTYTVLDATLNIVILENFPTSIRATSTAQVQMLGHILCGIVILFLKMPCQFTYIYIGSLMLASSTVAYFLPESRGKPIVE